MAEVGGTATETDEDPQDTLLHSTRGFWNDFIVGNFASLEKSLSPNCQIRHNFHESPVVSGILLCLDHLKELCSRLRQPSSKLDLEHIQHLRLMKNKKQVRFMIFGKSGYANSNYGFSFDWSCSFIVEMVIIRNTSASVFFIDKTSSPPVSTEKSTKSSEAIVKPYLDTGVMLIPPYLVPRPPIVPATLTITVMECRNLKSRLIRVIERSVCSYVIVEFCGLRRRTETIKYNNFPCYDVHNSFVFEFNDQQRKSLIHFTIMDEHLINDDVLASTEIPLEALPNRLDSSNPVDITLPLILQGNLLDDTVDSRNRVDEFPPALVVRISKVDAQEWWFGEEIKARADAEAKRIERLEELEKEAISRYSLDRRSRTKRSEASSYVSEHLHADSAQGREPEVAGSSREHWVDSSHVLMCME